MPEPAPGTRERILHLLKIRGPKSADELAALLGLTSMGVRGHLHRLRDGGLVAYEEERHGVGRPRRRWRLTPAADARFPQGHAELLGELLDSARSTLGEAGVLRLVGERLRRQLARYHERLATAGGGRGLARRVAALARLRRDEGYMADWSRERDGGFVLVEHHCPIRSAAEGCRGLCDAELDLFRELLAGAAVERSEHLLEGSTRCSYRIRPRED